MGFFVWIREGVRRAVLLGFSDAVTQIGDRQEGEDLGQHLAASLRQGLSVEADGKTATATIAAPSGRKRLGKSLEQIRNEGG
ncbi:MAG TPA: hypothetical protein VG056_12630 [Pirellulales bacterium]|jgi:hypothetical protein|nr:hypothetical protein [Pirellulales bacterium]